MLETIAIILLVLWLLGYGVLGAGGNAIHALIVLAVVLVVVRLVQGRSL